MWRSVHEFTGAGASRVAPDPKPVASASHGRRSSAATTQDESLARLAKCLRLTTLFWTGLLAGWFLSFDLAVMPGLGRVAAAEAARAMSSIDLAVRGSTLFGIVFFGSALLHAATALEGLIDWRHTSGRLCFAAAAVFLLGVFLPTLMANVPLGEMLTAAPGALGWETYGPSWDAWNGLRAMSAIGSFLALAVVVVFETPERRDVAESARPERPGN